MRKFMTRRKNAKSRTKKYNTKKRKNTYNTKKRKNTHNTKRKQTKRVKNLAKKHGRRRGGDGSIPITPPYDSSCGSGPCPTSELYTKLAEISENVDF